MTDVRDDDTNNKGMAKAMPQSAFIRVNLRRDIDLPRGCRYSRRDGGEGFVQHLEGFIDI